MLTTMYSATHAIAIRCQKIARARFLTSSGLSVNSSSVITLRSPIAMSLQNDHDPLKHRHQFLVVLIQTRPHCVDIGSPSDHAVEELVLALQGFNPGLQRLFPCLALQQFLVRVVDPRTQICVVLPERVDTGCP